MDYNSWLIEFNAPPIRYRNAALTCFKWYSDDSKKKRKENMTWHWNTFRFRNRINNTALRFAFVEPDRKIFFFNRAGKQTVLQIHIPLMYIHIHKQKQKQKLNCANNGNDDSWIHSVAKESFNVSFNVETINKFGFTEGCVLILFSPIPPHFD